MRIRNRKNLHIKTGIVLIFCIIPVSLFGFHIVNILNVYGTICNFQFDDELAPDVDDFMEVDFASLEEMANWTDDRFVEFHMPNNLSSAATFTDATYTTPALYHYSDNEALWTGTAYNGWVHKYLALVKENAPQTQVDDTLNVIENLTGGLAMLMAVPNGGLGPNFPGKLARCYAYPNKSDIKNTFLHDDTNVRHVNGTDGSHISGGVDYSQYRWRTYTSNDEYGGYYLFMALALKYMAPVSAYINETIYKIVDQNAQYMLQTNFLAIHENGAPNGPNQLPKIVGSGGFWAAIVLKMAAICYPEKYDRIYYHYLTSELLHLSVAESEAHQPVGDYYAYNFASDLCFGFLLLLDDDGLYQEEIQIKQHFYNGYKNSLWNNVKNHRNAYFNSMYLALQAEYFGVDGADRSTMTTEYKTIEYDIQDQLMRMNKTHKGYTHFPQRYYNRNQTQADLPTGMYEEAESVVYWRNFIQESPMAWLYGAILSELDLDDVVFTRPLTMEYRHTTNFIWQRTPYTFVERLGGNDGNYKEEAGISYLVPYWIARAHGFMNRTGVRSGL
ncbi:MAG: hypothetical protein GY870_10315 [archaeon]|nr:hypothetical protein [archaeon]